MQNVLPSALAAKPFKRTYVTVSKVDVDLSLTWVVRLLVTVIVMAALLVLFGLAALAEELYPAELLGITNPINFIVALGAIMTTVHSIVEPAIKRKVCADIRGGLESEDFREKLDSTNIMWYAGEGLAEAIAKEALSRAEEPFCNVS